ncbi:hypothetical protein IT411_03755 [Candidatus Peregrinibacteria bacterium]|nr:hypothetical protein [Candidatus Peregrinibacteria bacterium]
MPKANFPKFTPIYVLIAIAGLIVAFFAGVLFNNYNLQTCLESGKFYSECIIP